MSLLLKIEKNNAIINYLKNRQQQLDTFNESFYKIPVTINPTFLRIVAQCIIAPIKIVFYIARIFITILKQPSPFWIPMISKREDDLIAAILNVIQSIIMGIEKLIVSIISPLIYGLIFISSYFFKALFYFLIKSILLLFLPIIAIFEIRGKYLQNTLDKRE